MIAQANESDTVNRDCQCQDPTFQGSKILNAEQDDLPFLLSSNSEHWLIG